ncbi:MAG: single-stranded DNA-binding protein [Nitrospirae bacterium]|nr:single-stranded DNA-binding protein [Nitrospirota bacterium]
MNLNRVHLIGRLTDTPQLRATATGSVCNMSIAINGLPKKGTKERPVTYVPIAVFGKQADTCAANLEAGQEVNVEGRLQFRKRDVEGKKITVGEVVAHHIDFGMKPRRTMPAAA